MSLQAREALLFLKKKKQKDFFMLGHGLWPCVAPMNRGKKSFLVLFFKKERLP